MPLLPPHKTYVEPFGGSAGILLKKEPALVEVYNDLDNGAVAFFRCLREPKLEKELLRVLRLTPWARVEAATNIDEPNITDVECARRFYCHARMSFSALLHGGFRATGGRWAKQFIRMIEDLPKVAARMREVVIENQDFEKLIRRFDGPDTLFYLDPPYYLSTLSNADYPYRVGNFDYRDHARLICLLKDLKGKAILSGYDCPAYNAALKGWRTERREFSCCSSDVALGQKKPVRVEVLWIKE